MFCSLCIKRKKNNTLTEIFLTVVSTNEPCKWFGLRLWGPDLDPNCLQRLSADNKSRR